MRPLLQLALAGAVLAGCAACTHVQAATPRPSALDVPAPPPRVVVPPSADVTDPEPAPPATTPAPVAPSRTHDTTPPVKPPDKPAAPPTPAAAAPPPPETAAPQPLETTSDTNALEAQTQQLLANAVKDLGHVDHQALGPDARAQFDRAWSFVKQAQSAIKERNLTYARNMAEKAAALAGQLPKTKSGRPGLTASAA